MNPTTTQLTATGLTPAGARVHAGRGRVPAYAIRPCADPAAEHLAAWRPSLGQVSPFGTTRGFTVAFPTPNAMVTKRSARHLGTTPT